MSESEKRTRISKKTNTVHSGSQFEDNSSSGESRFQEVTKTIFPCISATTSTLTPATHVADGDSP